MKLSATIVLLALLYPIAPQGAEAVPPAGASYRVLSAVDGDTLVLSSEGHTTKIRLLGVAPVEAVSHAAYRTLASKWLMDQFRDRAVHLRHESPPRRDKYGCIVSYVHSEADG